MLSLYLALLLSSTSYVALSEILASGVASWTYYDSYPACCPGNPNYDPNADTSECTDYSGCTYSGDFAAIGHKSFAYVQSTDLIAFYDNNDPNGKSFNSNYGGKYITLTKNGVSFTALIADTCGNSDCGGCCATNSKPSGYLVDMEYYTVMRHFKTTDVVDGQISFVIGTAPPPPSTSPPTTTPPTSPPPTTTPPPPAPAPCSWAGHCAGASCSSDNDCDGVLTCTGGKCSGGSSSPPPPAPKPPTTPPPPAPKPPTTPPPPAPKPPTTPPPPAPAPCSWAGHCAGASCSSDNDCDGDLVCKSGKCAAAAANVGTLATDTSVGSSSSPAPTYSSGVPGWAVALLCLGSVIIVLLLLVALMLARKPNTMERV